MSFDKSLTNTREIIDESDVYIDVHKAIRRMAPAPKARVQKGHIVEPHDPATVSAPEDQLIDISEGGTPLKRSSSATHGDRSTPSPAMVGASPKTTTFMRRSSGGTDGLPITVRGTVDEMREHLKHLGPSNLASRPKTTRYNTVKIKSGHGPSRSDSRTESTMPVDPIIEEPYRDEPHHAAQGGEGEGLLKSAGKDASDGVQAVQQGYGSISVPKSPDSPGRFTKNEIYVDGEARDSNLSVNKARQSQSPVNRPLSRHDSNGSGRSSDTLGDLNGSSSRKKRGTARSGSITENIVEAGGIRKVILETNSSSDDRDENGNEHHRLSPESLDEQADSHDDHAEQPTSSKGEEAKKKRRRNRKKKSAKSGGEEGSGAPA
jgi:metal transporter CNNM